MENQNVVSVRKGGELLTEAWDIYKNNWKMFLPIMAIPLLVGLVGNILGERGEDLGWKYMLEWLLANPALAALYIILVVAFVVMASLSQLALMYVIKNLIHNQPSLTLKETYALALKNLLSYWWISFLLGLIIIGGVVLLIIPGIVFGVWYGFAPFALVGQDLKGMKALNQSKEYVKGRGWTVFGRIVFVCLVILVVSMLYTLALGLMLGEVVTNLVILPISMLYFFLLYKNLIDTKSLEAVASPVMSSVPAEQ